MTVTANICASDRIIVIAGLIIVRMHFNRRVVHPQPMGMMTIAAMDSI